MDLDIKYCILYYGRNQYFQTMYTISQNALKKFPNDISFKLFSGYALIMCGRYQEGIRELDYLQTMKELNIGVIVALIFAHKSCQTVDKEAVSSLDERLKIERKSSVGMALYYGALFFYLQMKFEKARDYLERFLKQNGESPDGLVLKGWIELNSDKGTKFKTSSSCFKIVLEKDRKNLDASLGLVKIKELEKNYSEAIPLINQTIVKHNSSVLPLIEKMRIQLCMRDWDQVLETSNRILALDVNCIDAYTMKTLVVLCKEGNFNEGGIYLKKLIAEIENSEAKNSKLLINVANLFSSIACQKSIILQETLYLVEKAAQLEPGNANWMAALGNQHLMMGKLKEATRCFKNSTKLDDSSIIGLTGLTLCQIMSGSINEQVKQQVDFLREVESDDPSPELLLMSAKMNVTAEDAAATLHQAIAIQLKKIEDYPFGINYIKRLNIDFLLQAVKENLKWTNKNSTNSHLFYKNCLVILEEIRSACPGLLDPQFQLARINFLMGNLTEAKEVLTHVLDELDSTLADAHVLMAQIHLQQKNYSLAARSLENSLSYNFQIREHPLYHLISAMVHKQSHNSSDALKSLKQAMSSPGFQGARQNSGDDSVLVLSLTDKATIYLELIQAYLSLHQQSEADKLINTCMEEFKGTTEEGRMFVANSELLIAKGNVKGAISALQKIQPGESYYVLARKTLADVYLNHLRNREMFAECYEDLVKISPSKEAYEMLGDAYTSIQDPDSAIAAYEEALKYNANDSNLICKMGKSLVKTHYFTKAINYYKEAVKSNDNPQLVYDMAELYFKLGQLDNAERILTNHANDKLIDSSDIVQLTSRTNLLQLLAKVRDKSGSLTDSLSALKEAKENHCKMDKRTLAQSDIHKGIVVDICTDTALLLTRLRDFNGAIKAFKEALTFRPNDPKVLVGLARLYMQTNNIEECQLACQHLLATDSDSEPAAVMLADIAFRKLDLETSAHHFKQLLMKRPDYWTALARLIEVMRRLGKLEDMKTFMDKAEAQCTRANQEAGLFFCKGLHDSYIGEPQQALTYFNRARGDLEWGEQATYRMIEICLNPDHDTIGGEDFYYDMVDNEMPDAKENALKTAQRLLMEIKPRDTNSLDIDHRLLENFWLLATRQKVNVEKALQDLVKIASEEYYKEHVGVGLAISTAFMLQKQVQKARNILKRMVKTQWRFEDAEHLERSWLLLTDIHIQGGKTDLAADLIQRVLEHNKSCYKAYEYAGYIAEKEQLHKEAAFQYENAWKYSAQSNPAIGFKLAFNYMKGKSYADAIDICHAVLKINPNYPRIKKDILEKSRNHLRT